MIPTIGRFLPMKLNVLSLDITVQSCEKIAKTDPLLGQFYCPRMLLEAAKADL